MPILIAIAAILLFAAIFAPQWWVKHALKKHSAERSDFPGTGGELADHLIKHFGLEDVHVTKGSEGQDYYDPEAKLISLSPNNYDGKSITAVSVAAHEFGHALQHHEGDRLLTLRTQLMRIMPAFETLAVIVLSAAPVIAVFAKSPILFLLQVLCAVGLMGARVLAHGLTLPVEFDASFNKALPILREGGYVQEADMPAATTVLRAAALTYVAAALMTLVNIAYWFRILR